MAKLRDLFAAVAPIASMVLGTAHPVAGIAFNAIAEGLGVSVTGNKKKDEAALEEAVRHATPEQLIALRQVDATLEVRLAELGFAREKLEADTELALAQAANADRADARAMARIQGTQPQMIIFVCLVMMASALSFGVFTLLDGPEPNAVVIAMLSNILGFLWRDLGASIQFFVGTTEGSARKTAAMIESRKQ